MIINLSYDHLSVEIGIDVIAIQDETDGTYHPPVIITPEQLEEIYCVWDTVWGGKNG